MGHRIYDPEQRFPAATTPTSTPAAMACRPGLRPTARWKYDPVLWHTFTAHRVVRPEDWLVMPVSHVGLELRADGFFDGNPRPRRATAEHCHKG